MIVAMVLLAFAGCDDTIVPSSHDIVSGTDNIRMESLRATDVPAFPSDPTSFVAEITNPYFAFETGKIFHYAAETEDGLETNTVEITADRKMILGVATTVIHDQVFLDGELKEDTFDWMAQDEDGNVWYFGEDSREIEDGQVVSTEGSWEAGVNGAMPGIIMLAQPKNGMKYQQESAEDVAEDMATVINTSKIVEIDLGVFEDCLETMEFTPLEPGHREHKFYKPGVGLLLELSPREGHVTNELVQITPP